MKYSYAILALLGIAGGAAYYAHKNKMASQDVVVEPFGEEEHEFIRFISKHQKAYGTREEYNMRLQNFANEYNNIKIQNARGGATWGVNMFSDYTR